MNKSILLCLLVLAIACSAALGGTAYSPKAKWALVWEPCRGDAANFSGTDGDNLVTRVSASGSQSQGYSVIRYIDGDDDDDAVGDCTRSNFNSLKDNVGILMLSTHGEEGKNIAVNTTDQGVADTWIGTDTDMHREWDGSRYVVKVDSSYYKDHWQTDVNSTRAIVFLGQCYSSVAQASPALDSVLDAIGGRVGWGYDHVVYDEQASRDVDLLFGRMNGRLPATAQGSARTAGAAHALGGLSWQTGDTGQADIVKRGEDDTTLCPSVTQAVKSCSGNRISVTITLDTVCDSSVDIANVLQFTTMTNATLRSRSWIGDCGLWFEVDVTGSPWTIEGRVEADYTYQKDTLSSLHRLNLDGNADPASTNAVAPNKDDYNFKYTGP